jgi:hypothetical protein
MNWNNFIFHLYDKAGLILNGALIIASVLGLIFDYNPIFWLLLGLGVVDLVIELRR